MTEIELAFRAPGLLSVRPPCQLNKYFLATIKTQIPVLKGADFRRDKGKAVAANTGLDSFCWPETRNCDGSVAQNIRTIIHSR